MDSKKVFSYKTNREDIYRVYFNSINGILNLTKKEISIAAKFYQYLDEIEQSVSDKKLQSVLLFSSDSKQRLRQELDIKSMLLNNYIASLKDKRIITEIDGTKYLNEQLRIDTTKDHITVIFNFTM